MSHFVYNPRTVGQIKLHASTMAPATIAIIMRCPVSTIELICRKHGIEMRGSDLGEPEPAVLAGRKQVRRRVDIEIDGLTFHLITREASRRGVTGRELISQLAEAVAEASIYSAVLDT